MKLRLCVPIVLVVLLGLAGLVQLHFVLNTSQDSPLACTQLPGIQWVRDPSNCSLYTMCIAGQDLQMLSCSLGFVWSNKDQRCVREDSELDDCSRVLVPVNTLTVQEDVQYDGNITMNGKTEQERQSRILEGNQESTELVAPNEATETTGTNLLDNTGQDSHCVSCGPSLDNCVGLADGLQPVPTRQWTSWFSVCKNEKRVDYGQCAQNQPIFSPVTLSCAPLHQVPKEYGGRQTSCKSRSDGMYPDEGGLCHRFFYCQNEVYVRSEICAEKLFFNPETLTCADSVHVPPCGLISPSLPDMFCSGRSDGFYADLYGRCSLYYECKTQTLRAYLKCPYGSFNPRRKECDMTLDLPAPCGVQPNHCMSKPDGVYPDTGSDCRAMVACTNGYVSQVEPCPEGRVFDDATKKCQRPESTLPPCGMAPSCMGKEDGKHASTLKGCHHYFTCSKETFTGYGSCILAEGGLFFNPDTRSCDYPHNICPPCGNKHNCFKD